MRRHRKDIPRYELALRRAGIRLVYNDDGQAELRKRDGTIVATGTDAEAALTAATSGAPVVSPNGRFELRQFGGGQSQARVVVNLLDGVRSGPLTPVEQMAVLLGAWDEFDCDIPIDLTA
jgi:hypothetical protein